MCVYDSDKKKFLNLKGRTKRQFFLFFFFFSIQIHCGPRLSWVRGIYLSRDISEDIGTPSRQFFRTLCPSSILVVTMVTWLDAPVAKPKIEGQDRKMVGIFWFLSPWPFPLAPCLYKDRGLVVMIIEQIHVPPKWSCFSSLWPAEGWMTKKQVR